MGVLGKQPWRRRNPQSTILGACVSPLGALSFDLRTIDCVPVDVYLCTGVSSISIPIMNHQVT